MGDDVHVTREDELIARIKSGEPIATIRKWFLTDIRNTDPDTLTPFEQAFWDQTISAYQAWLRTKQQH